MAILSKSEIQDMGFASVGDDVRISSKASLYNCANIR